MSTDKKKCRIFISHASADANELVPIVDMLPALFELQKEEITFTALPETGLANFSRFNETLRKAIQESDLIIIYLTNTYIQREYCLYELGAIWGLNKNCFLINRDGISKEKLPELLLGHTYSKLDDTCIDQLFDLLEELHFNRLIKRTADYNSRKKRALEQIEQARQNTGENANPVPQQSSKSETDKKIKTINDKLNWQEYPIQMVGQYFNNIFETDKRSAYISECFQIDATIKQQCFCIAILHEVKGLFLSCTRKKPEYYLLLDKESQTLISKHPANETEKNQMDFFSLLGSPEKGICDFPFSPHNYQYYTFHLENKSKR